MTPTKAGCTQYLEEHGYCVLTAGHDGDCTLHVKGAVPSSEEAANSDTDRLDWLEANGGFSHDDVDRGMSMSQWGRNWDKITLREAIDKAKLAARVQGENSQ